MDVEQRKRYEKLFTDEYYLLETVLGVDDGVYTLAVLGSKRDVYHVRVSPADHTLACNCPDAMTHARRWGVLCKHCVFVAQRVLRLDFAVDVFPHRRVADPAKWAQTLDRLNGLRVGSIVDGAVFDPTLTQQYQERKPPAPAGAGAGAGVGRVGVGAGMAAGAGAAMVHTDGAGAGAGAGAGTGEAGGTDDEWRPILARLDTLCDEDVCAICFVELVPAHPATPAMASMLQACKRCNGLVHTRCMDRWRQMGRGVCTRCNQQYTSVELQPPSVLRKLQEQQEREFVLGRDQYVNLRPPRPHAR